MSNEKPYRKSQVTLIPNEPEDPIFDRRLSDLLPSEFIKQVGLDPDQYIFKTSNEAKIRRRATDPGLTQTDQSFLYRRASQVDSNGLSPPYGSPLILPKSQQMVSCFIVELSDVKVDAYSSQQIPFQTSAGVIVRDGCFLRFGRIISKIQPESCDESALQIITLDIDNLIGDYILGQTQIAQELLPSFLIQCGAKCNLLDVETVSYQARSLIRVKVSNADDPMLPYVVQKLVMIFCSPVEIYD